ncbi:MAG: phenylalanine--tRNA ligase subunit beta [Exilibacterium sp.]
MKFNESWLRKWVNPDLSSADLIEQITMAGLEVDATEPVAGVFSGVVVGEITAIEQHPNADKLSVCQVSTGTENIQVVCGAPNARAGLKAPFATLGAVLPGEAGDNKGFKIKKTKLRGVESCGMLCAQTELQAGDDASGLWELPEEAPVGTALEDYLQLNDTVIELDLTPNRSDCLSIKGIAREVGVLNRSAVNNAVIEPVPASVDDSFPVALEAGAQCPRYAGRVIRNIDIGRPSPLWLRERLRRCGLRSIDPVVDVTNYVLLELGQPMHAFDLNTLAGGIVVRMAKSGETLTLLDGQDVTLNPDTLVIADREKALAMAGIMGGMASAVNANTRDVFLESAFFAPTALAGRARSYGLHTDSSHRFERGVDFRLQEQALERATRLLLDIVGGEPGPLIVTEDKAQIPAARQVTLRRARIGAGLGLEMDAAEVEDILTRLGLEKRAVDEQGWTFEVPSYRFDIAIEADLLEELARIYGYNRLPTTSVTGDLALRARTETKIGLTPVRRQMVARGYQEVITYSFVEPGLVSLFDPEAQPVALQNPISADMSVMRTSLWPGLVKTLQHNLNRQQERVRLFETGLRFVRTDKGLVQEPVLAAAIYGARFAENWTEKTEKVDFYDIKGDLESVLELTGASETFSFSADTYPGLHPGQCAAIDKAGKTVGYLGAIHPRIQHQLELTHPVYLFEITQAAVLDSALPEFKKLSKFPEVRRDLAFIIDQNVAVGAISKAVRSMAGNYLEELKVFDLYVGKGIDPHRKSVALGLTFQHPSRTLNDNEINASVDTVVKGLEVEFNATLR